MAEYTCSTTVIGFLNFCTLIASFPIIGSSLWMSKSTTTCESFLQKPLLVVGFIILIISLAGFIGACFNEAWALWVYLVVMLILIAGLLGFTIFGFVVTSHGGGVEVPGKMYREYHLEDYSNWLKKKIKNPHYWMSIKSCILGSRTCDMIVLWTPMDYSSKNMSPVQSGCCKPPSLCVYGETAVAQEGDCYKWNNAPGILCYDCDSCKAGVLENLRMQWQKISVINIVVVLLLIVIYTIGCCAFQNTKRAQTHYPFFGQNRMYKGRPRWDFNWGRWWHDRRHQFF